MMRKKLTILLAVAAMLTFGLMTNPVFAGEIITVTETVEIAGTETELERVVDNFIVLYDSSSTMSGNLGTTGKRKIDAEKQILKDRNAMLPDLSWKAGLYSFTPGAGRTVSKVLKPYYDLKPWNKAAFGQAIDGLPTKASGPTFLQKALLELDPILGGLSGRTAVIVFTDGRWTRWGGEGRTPVMIAKELANKHDVCFTMVNTGGVQSGTAMLKEIAGINSCSRVITFRQMLAQKEYFFGTLFVVNEKVVKDYITREKVVGFKIPNVLFAFDSAAIGSEYRSELNALGSFLQKNPNANAHIYGYTDSVGDGEYNLALSERRAMAVANHLKMNYNISEDRIVALWYGEADPVATNDTSAGRRLNRRAVTVITGM